jgi:Protein of unknown function DUF262
MTESTQSQLRLQADTDTVENLVNQVKRGLVRVPDFQRPLRWASGDVVLLFDSIYQGYPIGSFLMRRAHAPASFIKYGPVKVNAPETNSALWVVDGQQRLTALTAGLARSETMPKTPDDAWVLYFDAEHQKFNAPPRSGIINSTWVPITQLLDASALSEWVFNWEHSNNQVLRKSVFDAGARIRQYEIPLYIVETEKEELLRQIFYRINDSGKKMSWEDIHDALFGRKLEQPSTLSGLAEALQKLGVGRPSEEQLLSAIIAFKGLDVTQSISDHYRRDPQVLRNAVNDALPALKGALIFLKTYAEIPHLRLLPRLLPLVVLTRFFALYQEPNRRTIDLLIRWTWRTLLNIRSFDERTILRHSLKAIKDDKAIKEDDEEIAIQRLLKVVPSSRASSFSLPQKFDARAADSRIALVALSSLQPLSLEDGKAIDIAELIEAQDLNAFRKIISSGVTAVHSSSNRILLTPNTGSARKELSELIRKDGVDSPLLMSHCIDEKAAEYLLHGEFDKFLSRRGDILAATVDSFGSRLASWDTNDRPSIDFILHQTGGNE